MPEKKRKAGRPKLPKSEVKHVVAIRMTLNSILNPHDSTD
jgi:hypothetical protein